MFEVYTIAAKRINSLPCANKYYGDKSGGSLIFCDFQDALDFYNTLDEFTKKHFSIFKAHIETISELKF